MKKIISALASVVIFGLAWNCLSAELPVPAQERVAQNYLVNPGFENGTYGWSVSGGATKTANTTAKGEGNYGFDWDSNSASQTLTQSITVPAGLAGANGIAWCSFKVPSGSATHTIVVDDGSGNSLGQAATTINNSTNFVATTVSFLFGSSGSTARFKITSVASNEPEIYIDSCFFGKAFGSVLGSSTVNVSDASTTITPSAGFGTTSLQSTWVGRIQDKAYFRGYFKTGTVAGSVASIALPSGYVIDSTKFASTSQAQMVGWYQTILTGTNANMAVTSRGPIFYDGSDTANLYFANQSGANVYKKNNGSDIFNSSDGVSFQFTVPITTFTDQSNYRTDQTPASWAGRMTVASGWTTTSTTYGDTTTGTSIVLTEERNRNFGTVSAIAGSLPGITFNPPRAGNYWVCASGSIISTNLQYMSIRMIDSNSVVIHNGLTTYANVATATEIFSGLCGIAQPTSTAAYSIKLQTATSSGTMTITNGSGSGASGTPAIEWSIIGLDAAMPTPYLINGVVSDSSGVEKIARVKYYTTAAGTVCSADPCGATSSVSGITVNKNATGDYTITFPSGTFSSTPTCTINPSNASNTLVPIFTSASSTTYRFTTNNSSSGAAANTFGDVLCMGPK